MKNISTLAKVLAFLSLASLSVWLGSYLTRLFVVYQLFEGPELVLRSYVTDQNIKGILTSFTPVIITPFISYIIWIISFTLFLILSKVSLKENGWLFIILVAVLVMLPFEIYLMINDYKTFNMIISSTFDSNVVISLLKDRIRDLSSFPIVEIIIYLSFFFFIIFRPLTKTVIKDK